MAKLFYLKLAWSNVKRNRLTYVPYLLAIALMSGFFLLIVGLINSETLNNVPAGDSAQQMFSAGIIIFTFLAVFFMLYINNFLVNRRKREFGLYSVLGLEKRHIARVLAFENAIVTLGGLLLGTIFALVFGYLLFLILLKMLNFVGDSSFSLPPKAFILTYGLFAAVFVVTTIWNTIRVGLINSMSLLQSEKRGERPSKLMIPAAVLGLAMLAFAYYQAWTIEKPSEAIVMFLLLVMLVIVATFLLFSSGSTLLLSILRKIKGYYYKPKNFVSVSGMFHRMRQNARGLSFICILSTMLVVTVAGTLSLYVGRERIYREQHPYDVITEVFSSKNEIEANTEYSKIIYREAEKYGVTIHASADKLTSDPAYSERGNYVFEPSETRMINGLVYANRELMFDVDGESEACMAFVTALDEYDGSNIEGYQGKFVHEIFSERQQGLGLYGGLVFLGAFFGVLFLAMTVLIIYFKQVTEGYEDKQRFVILQQVGMDKRMVKGTINRQVQWMFFLPLGATLLHMFFASKIMSKMLALFQLFDWQLVLICIGCVCAVFVLLYLLVFRLTARAYYKIVAFEHN